MKEDINKGKIGIVIGFTWVWSGADMVNRSAAFSGRISIIVLQSSYRGRHSSLDHFVVVTLWYGNWNGMDLVDCFPLRPEWSGFITESLFQAISRAGTRHDDRGNSIGIILSCWRVVNFPIHLVRPQFLLRVYSLRGTFLLVHSSSSKPSVTWQDIELTPKWRHAVRDEIGKYKTTFIIIT